MNKTVESTSVTPLRLASFQEKVNIPLDELLAPKLELERARLEGP